MFKETHLPRSAFSMNSFIRFSVTKNRSKNAAPSDRAQHQTFVAGKSESMSQHLLKKNHHHHHNHYYYCSWLVVSTHLKNISQIGSFPQGSGWKKKYLSCHHPGSCHPFLYFTIPNKHLHFQATNGLLSPHPPTWKPCEGRHNENLPGTLDAQRPGPWNTRYLRKSQGFPREAFREVMAGPPSLREISIRKGRMKDVYPGIDFTKEGIWFQAYFPRKLVVYSNLLWWMCHGIKSVQTLVVLERSSDSRDMFVSTCCDHVYESTTESSMLLLFLSQNLIYIVASLPATSQWLVFPVNIIMSQLHIFLAETNVTFRIYLSESKRILWMLPPSAINAN